MRYLLACALGVVIFAAASAEAAEVRDLMKKLASKDVEQRREAAKELGDMGAEAKDAVPALKKAVRDSDLFVRRFSIEALGKIGPDAKSAIPEVALGMNDEKKEVALASAEALGRMGPDAIKPLTSAVKDTNKDPQVRKKAALSLGNMGLQARGAVQTLSDVLTGKISNNKTNNKKKGKDLTDNDIRVEVATALGSIAKAEDTAAIEALKSVSEGKQNKKNKMLKQAASEALRKINSTK
jgi:HEAT repeat protein